MKPGERYIDTVRGISGLIAKVEGHAVTVRSKWGTVWVIDAGSGEPVQERKRSKRKADEENGDAEPTS